jgi:rod shape-determining protein MreD
MSFVTPKFDLVLGLSIAILLQIIPLPIDLMGYRPNFILVMVLMVTLHYPKRHSLNMYAVAGLIADGVNDTSFGHFMLVFVLCGGVVSLLSRWTSYFASFYRICVVLFLSLLGSFLQGVIAKMQGLSSPLEIMPTQALIAVLFFYLCDRLVLKRAT